MKGILFTEILFNKTVAKEKTMTRREHGLKVINANIDEFQYKWFDSLGNAVFDHFDIDTYVIKPTYKVGEVVYIKEPWAAVYYDESGGGDVLYKYDFPESERHLHQWSNKLFTGADKGRYYIRITDVKCERLFSISDEDCLKEGVDELLIGNGAVKLKEYPLYDSKNGETTISIRRSFFSLFRFANRVPKSKEIPNLWVFCYSYCLCDINGNEL